MHFKQMEHLYDASHFHRTLLGHYNEITVGSRLSEPRLSVSGHLDVSSSCHVFGTSGKKTLRSLEFCYRRKQSCCTNDFPERYNAFSMQYGIQITIYNVQATCTCILAKPRTLQYTVLQHGKLRRRGKQDLSWLQSLACDRLIVALSLFYWPRPRFRLTLRL